MGILTELKLSPRTKILAGPQKQYCNTDGLMSYTESDQVLLAPKAQANCHFTYSRDHHTSQKDDCTSSRSGDMSISHIQLQLLTLKTQISKSLSQNHHQLDSLRTRNEQKAHHMTNLGVWVRRLPMRGFYFVCMCSINRSVEA
jgi:hypothetical protein